MALSAGIRLGPYTILEPLGAGGMGEVYLAQDTRLGREVAIKVLPAEVSGDAGRLKRFEKEAHAASALNHPNIVTIYEIDEIDSVRFIAMERVDGKTLRELLRTGPLSTKRLVEIATQTAGGLAKAHEAGIVHRDLKPENLMVTPDGLVKILDFGLAKLTQAISVDGRISQLQTETRTSPGMIVGTVGYMSPEQARGEAVDVRSDQFSFGSILYEMATGNRPFQKATAVDTLSAILHEEPEPVSVLNPDIPAPLRWTLERCHSKEPSGRYDSTGDLARELASLRQHFSEVTSPKQIAVTAPAPRPHGRRLLLAVAAVGVLAVGLGLGWVLARWLNAPEHPRFRRITNRHGMSESAFFAPGGQAIVYSASREGRPFRLFTMNLESTDPRDLGIEGRLTSISPTGELLALRSQDPFGGAIGDLWLASLSGAAPRALAENVRAASFSRDGSEIALIRAVDAPGVRYRLEFPLGEVLYESNAELFGRPGVSPDGRRVTVAERTDTGTDILTVDRSGRRSTIVSFPRTSGVYAFVGVRGRSWIMRGNERSGTEVLEVTSAGKLRSRLRIPLWFTLADVAAGGRWLIQGFRSRTEMLVFEAGAAGPRNISWSGGSRVADLSADGRTVLFTEETGDSEYSVYIRKVDGSPAMRLGAGRALSLSPGGLWALVAPSLEGDELALYPTGPGETRSVSIAGARLVGGRFFPSGDRLLLLGRETEGTRCYVLHLEEGDPQPLGPADALLPRDRSDQAVIAADGRTVLLGMRDGWWRVAAAGGEAVPVLVEGLGPEERVMRSRDDGQAVFTKREEAAAIVIEAVELATGRRSLVRRLPLGEGAFASARLHPARITPDGKTVVYSVFSSTSDLYLVEGLK